MSDIDLGSVRPKSNGSKRKSRRSDRHGSNETKSKRRGSSHSRERELAVSRRSSGEAASSLNIHMDSINRRGSNDPMRDSSHEILPPIAGRHALKENTTA